MIYLGTSLAGISNRADIALLARWAVGPRETRLAADPLQACNESEQGEARAFFRTCTCILFVRLAR
jgi:hypothetical protein